MDCGKGMGANGCAAVFVGLDNGFDVFKCCKSVSAGGADELVMYVVGEVFEPCVDSCREGGVEACDACVDDLGLGQIELRIRMTSASMYLRIHATTGATVCISLSRILHPRRNSTTRSQQ